MNTEATTEYAPLTMDTLRRSIDRLKNGTPRRKVVETYPLKRFDEVYGEGDGPAYEHGPGAFCWTEDGYGRPYICFLTPEPASLGNRPYNVHSIPVSTDRYTHGWWWNGNKDYPIITPSIRTTSGITGETLFHGYIKGDVLEVLDD